MPVKKLTAVSLPHLPEGEWHDAILPGLILRVGKKRRSWSVRYHANGSYQRVALGHFPAMELGVARDAARAVIDRAERGLPAEAPQPHPRSADVLTLGALLDHYEKMRIREGTRIKALPRTQRVLRLHLRPYLALPVAQFDKAGLRAIRNELVVSGRPAAANKLLTALSPCLRWAAAEDLIEVDFTSAIRRMPARARERKLTEQEIRAVWTASLSLGATETAQSYGRLVRFLLVTAQRRDEAASLRYGHVIDQTWRQEQNKASRPHSLPLPPLAFELVGRGEARGLVFPGRHGKLGAFSSLKQRLDKASGVENWVLHDLRRTAASGMQDLRIRHEVISAILNHSLRGITAVYLRSELETQKAEALAAWATALTHIVGPMRVMA